MKTLDNGSLFGLIHKYLKVYLPKQRKVSPNTIRSYRGALELLVDFTKDRRKVPLKDVTFEMLTSETIAEFLDFLEDERGCSVATRNNRLAAIRAFLKYAADVDVSAVAFLKEIKKVPVKKLDCIDAIAYMSETAVTALITEPDAATPKGLRDRFFMVLLYDTGARMQEMLDIKLRDFRYGKTPTITLHGKGGKVRTVPIMKKTVEHLHLYLSVFHQNANANDRPLFFSVIHGQINPLSDDCVRKFLRKHGIAARERCLEVPEKVHAHLFRHSRAMHLYQHGMDLTLISQWLGHADLETTLVYAHADTEHKRCAIETATSNGNGSPVSISPRRFTVCDDDTLKRLSGLR
jgi:site-specific recombinase XerD